jgi:hypothetical protein
MMKVVVVVQLGKQLHILPGATVGTGDNLMQGK